jgi:hypothetical protein
MITTKTKPIYKGISGSKPNYLVGWNRIYIVSYKNQFEFGIYDIRYSQSGLSMRRKLEIIKECT